MKLLNGLLTLNITLFFSVFTCASAETQVSCVFNESCVLPCSFQSGSRPRILWLKTPGNIPVHSYAYFSLYWGEQERTSLFVDQISRGNASLLLREVKVQDEDTYRCNTLSNHISKTSLIYLRVRAPVGFVNIEQRGDELICSSKDIYPKPDVSWSLRPPPLDVEPNTSVSVSEEGLYSIFSSVTLSDKPPEEHSCNISTDHSWSSATYRLRPPELFSGNEATVPCSASNAPLKSLIWKFNHTQTILTQTGTSRVYNESWRQFVEEVSESGLTLKNLSSGHHGVYSCVLSSDRETLISSTALRITDKEVSCVFNESCVLPCSFQNGSRPVIDWLKIQEHENTQNVPVHSYDHSQDQDFKGRTSLFEDQISRGNASLLLTEVKVQDEGTYRCFTSANNTVAKDFFINLRVRAPVGFVNIEQRGDELICSSKDIYPKPDVSWSPPPDVEPHTSDSVSEEGLYSIFSSVTLSHKPPEEHSCNISTDHSWSSATYRLQRSSLVKYLLLVPLFVPFFVLPVWYLYKKIKLKPGNTDASEYRNGDVNRRTHEEEPF